jgi:hypothetical protein
MSYFDSLVKLANGKAAVDPNLPSIKPGLVDPTMAEVMRDDMVGKQWRYTDAAEDRIRELDAEIAKYKQELASYDTESEMGKYKFVWEGDPSTYTTVQQNKRNIEETRKIREASEAATKASNAQTAWKQLVLNMEDEKYKLASAQNRANEARATGNRSAYVDAMTDVKRSEAALTRFQREQAEYRKKFANMLGVALEDDTKAQDVSYNGEGDKNLEGIDIYEQLKSNLAKGKTDLRNRPNKMSKQEKNKLIKNAKNNLANFRQTAEGLKFLNPQTRSDLDKMLTEYEDSIPKFNKSQGTVMTQEEFNKKDYAHLKALGLEKLNSYIKKFGAGYPDQEVLKKALANAK